MYDISFISDLIFGHRKLKNVTNLEQIEFCDENNKQIFEWNNIISTGSKVEF